MINKFEINYLDEIMDIWLESNISAHHFVNKCFWENAYDAVRAKLPYTELYVYRDGRETEGFISLMFDNGVNYIPTLFVKGGCRSRGIGRKLLEHCKSLYSGLELDVLAKNEKAVNFYLKNGFEIKQTTLNLDHNLEEHCMDWNKNKEKLL